jgi:hypothetical protein
MTGRVVLPAPSLCADLLARGPGRWRYCAHGERGGPAGRVVPVPVHAALDLGRVPRAGAAARAGRRDGPVRLRPGADREDRRAARRPARGQLRGPQRGRPGTRPEPGGERGQPNAQVASPGFGSKPVKPYLTVTMKIVGKAVYSSEEVQDDTDTQRDGTALFTPALTRLLVQCCASFTETAVQLDPGTSVAAAEAGIQRVLPKGFPTVFYVTAQTEAKAERAIEPTSIALAVGRAARLRGRHRPVTARPARLGARRLPVPGGRVRLDRPRRRLRAAGLRAVRRRGSDRVPAGAAPGGRPRPPGQAGRPGRVGDGARRLGDGPAGGGRRGRPARPRPGRGTGPRPGPVGHLRHDARLGGPAGHGHVRREPADARLAPGAVRVDLDVRAELREYRDRPRQGGGGARPRQRRRRVDGGSGSAPRRSTA